MSIENVRRFFAQFERQDDILEFNTSSATVALAAEALGVIPARNAKTISFYGKEEQAILIVAAGDVKIDNSKFKQQFGLKAKMLSADDVLRCTGHEVGGVCPFALPQENLPLVYTDVSLKRFETVFPACGSSNSAIELTNEELYQFAHAQSWVDVCKLSE